MSPHGESSRAGALSLSLVWQARRLSPSERVAHARLFASILMEDFNGLAEACAALGTPLLRRVTRRDRNYRRIVEPRLARHPRIARAQ